MRIHSVPDSNNKNNKGVNKICQSVLNVSVEFKKKS